MDLKDDPLGKITVIVGVVCALLLVLFVVAMVWSTFFLGG